MKIVLTTLPAAQAEPFARLLVADNLAACVSSYPVRSCYRWDGEVRIDDEVQLVIKVASARVDGLTERIRASHPYELPELVVLDVNTALSSPAYVAWIGSASRVT